MSLFAIVLLIILGIFLLLIEFLVVPGITIAGVGGVLLIVTGVFLSYSLHGLAAGNFVLLGSVLFMVITIFFSLRSNTWRKTMLESKLEGKVNTYDLSIIKPGDTGSAVTRLGPMGKVEINGVFYEAKTTDIIINANTEITVVKVLNDKLIVKPTNLI
jgi:membrane-bound ClpP family serine protease